ncbi:MAG TPA: quinone oxidoreductase [Thermoanaerobaculia bacterium]|nr:quinone oxidoreductase [Thermoanaerobaculia bacterium]
MKAIRVHAPGGTEALVYEDVPDPRPKAGEAVVRVEAAGVNFIDVYYRTGAYKAQLPVTLGQEGAGTVLAVAPGVTEVAAGDRVAWAGAFGSYAESAALPAERLVRVPDGVSARQAAGAMLQGMTAHYLSHSTYALKAGDTCLIHAGAGGVGLLLTQMAIARGARVLTTVSTAEKARLSREAGADATINYTTEDFEPEVRRLTGGRGVQVVYDSVGRTTFEKGLSCLALRGMMVLFGQSSGAVAPLDPQVLAQRGSLYLTRPTLFQYVVSREELVARAGEVLAWVRNGRLKLRLEHDFPLAEAAAAHRALEGRTTTGKILLIP